MTVDISFWNAEQMPVVIEGLFGYTTDKVVVKGGTKYYHWIRIWDIGIEVCVCKAMPQREYGASEYQRRQA